jgi:YHS domain-containing protein
MAKAPAIGFVNCHVCGFDDAEVKLDKAGRAYIFCPDCNIQSFTRQEAQSEKLLARMRPLAGTVAPETVPIVAEIINKPPPKKGGFSMDDL